MVLTVPNDFKKCVTIINKYVYDQCKPNAEAYNKWIKMIQDSKFSLFLEHWTVINISHHFNLLDSFEQLQQWASNNINLYFSSFQLPKFYPCILKAPFKLNQKL